MKKKQFKPKSFSGQTQAEPDLIALINKMQQQLNFLEKKIDTLIGQSGERPQPTKIIRPFEHNGFKDRSFAKVTCSECGRDCQVPFQPSGGRPVYCRECFAQRKGGGAVKARPQQNDFRKKSSAPGRFFDKPYANSKRRR